jgi:hypothetical protein
MQHAVVPGTGTHLEAMWTAGLTEKEILNLVWLKQEVRKGKRSELTQEYKRRYFARYLYEHGLLRED